MGRMNNLLNKPLKAFISYSFIVLVCSIPVYFFMIDFIWLHEVDAHNRIRSESTKQNLRTLNLDGRRLEEVLQLWNHLQPEAKIQKVAQLKPDSTFNLYRKNRYIPGKGYDRFQGLVTYVESNGKFYSITVETNVEESYETISAITAVTGFFFIILLSGFIFLNKRISQKLWTPFYVSLQKIKSFELSSQTRPSFERTDIIEFEEMNGSLSRLIEGNIDVFRRQKEFTENASHELQTPLAIVQLKLDLLLQSSMLSAEQSSIIDDIHHALARVSRINKNLLLLAKIENLQFGLKEQVDLSAHLEKNIALFSDFLKSKNLTISCDILSGVVIKGNKMLVEVMLNNLLMNAVRHNIENGKIEVLLALDQLRISNSGTSALNGAKLFKRFSMAAPETHGSGLGLAIVQEICNTHGWNIQYNFEPKMHVFVWLF
jgi:signal transduction histidine kinase